MNKRPTFVLRFRTKKQATDMKRAAKAARFTLNEFIIRCVEDAVNSKQEYQPIPDNPFASLASQAPVPADN